MGVGLGFMLLLLRVGVLESGMFKTVQQSNVSKGNFFILFTNGKRFKKYITAILLGLPTWYVIGILITFSKEFSEHMNVQGTVDPGKSVMFAYAAISIGDVAAGFVSQWFRSRKKAVYLYYVIIIAAIIWYFNLEGQSADSVYLACALLGFGTGFWAMFVTMAAEQFGTNIRATVATTVPNMVRGSLTLVSLLFTSLQPSQGYLKSGWITGIVVLVIGIIRWP